MATTYLERYLEGEHERVWEELVALGVGVREEPLLADALAVARETLRRVRDNLEVLIPRLAGAGYQFGYGWVQPDAAGRFGERARRDYERELAWARAMPPLYTPPAPDTAALLEAFEAEAGVLPLSLRAFHEVVGAVNLVGAFAGMPPWGGLGGRTLDPLFVYPLAGMREEYARWLEEWESLSPEECLDEYFLRYEYEEEPDPERIRLPFPYPLAPDEYMKYHTSGAGGYEVEVPDDAADAAVTGAWREGGTFVDYLRTCFRWGGLPGLRPASPEPVELIERLTAGLLPF